MPQSITSPKSSSSQRQAFIKRIKSASLGPIKEALNQPNTTDLLLKSKEWGIWDHSCFICAYQYGKLTILKELLDECVRRGIFKEAILKKSLCGNLLMTIADGGDCQYKSAEVARGVDFAKLVLSYFNNAFDCEAFVNLVGTEETAPLNVHRTAGSIAEKNRNKREGCGEIADFLNDPDKFLIARDFVKQKFGNVEGMQVQGNLFLGNSDDTDIVKPKTNHEKVPQKKSSTSQKQKSISTKQKKSKKVIGTAKTKTARVQAGKKKKV